VLIISEDLLNQGPADLVVVLPLTSTHRGVPSHVPLSPPEGGLKKLSFALCEAIRSISKVRLVRRWGRISSTSLGEVEDRLRMLLGL
jgi:mRNA interferase MazF